VTAAPERDTSGVPTPENPADVPFGTRSVSSVVDVWPSVLFLTVRPENEPKGQTFIEQARRAQIVAAAVEVIAEVGYAKASLAAIAGRAAISKGVISYHFSGKDELMVTIVETIYGEAAKHILARMEGLGSATELVRTHVTAAAEYMRDRRAQLAALGQIFANLRASDGSPRYGMHTSEELFAGLERMYQGGQRSGEFRAFDTRVMAVTHQAGVDDTFGYWMAHPELDLDAYASSLADLYVNAVRKERP
jgi:TetR/AcrR family transcriptional regulator, fatty acid metabolism regulator protein